MDKIEFRAQDGGEYLGRIAGWLDGDTFVIDELECEEYFTDGLVRAILNLMTLHDIDKARFELPEHMNKLKALGFVRGEPVMNRISAFFDKGFGA